MYYECKITYVDRIHQDKFPEELRNFETRLLFIEELFTNLFSQCDIMAHCAVHKLD